jgi:hypothetical protein
LACDLKIAQSSLIYRQARQADRVNVVRINRLHYFPAIIFQRSGVNETWMTSLIWQHAPAVRYRKKAYCWSPLNRVPAAAWRRQ